ncbi:hypothetical protein B0H10DRAFT_2339228 [Mycena sp. CBHHK59/15]|nr:hypothetical protein B0H10DRAFT_2339228 [Mycena sp. CBHHK59/15]
MCLYRDHVCKRDSKEGAAKLMVCLADRECDVHTAHTPGGTCGRMRAVAGLQRGQRAWVWSGAEVGIRPAAREWANWVGGDEGKAGCVTVVRHGQWQDCGRAGTSSLWPHRHVGLLIFHQLPGLHPHQQQQLQQQQLLCPGTLIPVTRALIVLQHPSPAPPAPLQWLVVVHILPAAATAAALALIFASGGSGLKGCLRRALSFNAAVALKEEVGGSGPDNNNNADDTKEDCAVDYDDDDTSIKASIVNPPGTAAANTKMKPKTPALIASVTRKLGASPMSALAPMPASASRSSASTSSSTLLSLPVPKKKSRTASLLNSWLNASADNISLWSSVSSASMMIRKLGSVGHLTWHNSLVGIMSLFMDKKPKEGDEDGEGSGGRKDEDKHWAADRAVADGQHVSILCVPTHAFRGNVQVHAPPHNDAVPQPKPVLVFQPLCLNPSYIQLPITTVTSSVTPSPPALSDDRSNACAPSSLTFGSRSSSASTKDVEERHQVDATARCKEVNGDMDVAGNVDIAGNVLEESGVDRVGLGNMMAVCWILNKVVEILVAMKSVVLYGTMEYLPTTVALRSPEPLQSTIWPPRLVGNGSTVSPFIAGRQPVPQFLDVLVYRWHTDKLNNMDKVTSGKHATQRQEDGMPHAARICAQCEKRESNATSSEHVTQHKEIERNATSSKHATQREEMEGCHKQQQGRSRVARMCHSQENVQGLVLQILEEYRSPRNPTVLEAFTDLEYWPPDVAFRQGNGR